MKKLLRNIICVASMAFYASTTSFAQIKGDPQPSQKVQQPTEQKAVSKLSPDLKELHEKMKANAQYRAGGGSNTLQNYMQVKGDKVLVDFTARKNIETAKAELVKMGVIITATYGRVISGFVPINNLPKLEGAASIRFVKPAYKPMHQTIKANPLKQGNSYSSPKYPLWKPVISQGDTAQFSYLARKNFHVNGDGVKVGILSDSYNNLGTAEIGVQHGELPGKGNPFHHKKPVEILSDLDSGGTDEGRAMAEIVHDVAPGAYLAFHTAYNGEADFAQGIQRLANHGCKVIADDIFYLDEPFFQDGIIAQSVDIAKKRGVSYFSAAGNNFNKSYSSPYRPTNVAYFGPGFGTAHNFSGPENPPRYAQPLYVPSGGIIRLSFQWDQSSFAASGIGAESDLDIYLTDIYGNIVAQAATNNLLSGEPFEFLGYYNNTTNYTFFLTIMKYAGPDPHNLKYILYDDALFYLTRIPIPGILSPTLVGHAKAEGAIATGAAFYLQTPGYGVDTAVVEGFSSEGGTPNYYDINGNRIAPLVRKKPNIVAPDGGNTSFFNPFGNGDIPQDADTYPNFFGTSAAAPHAAGVAALMMDAEKLDNITPDQIKGILQNTASDMDDRFTAGFDKGFDFNTGYGFINAEKAVKKVKFPNQFLSNLKLEPICSYEPQKVRFWKIINPNPFDMEVEWFVQGNCQHAKLTVEPGETTFYTTAINNARGCNEPNIGVLVWLDNFNAPHFDVAFSTRAKCGVDKINDNNSDKSITVVHGLTPVDGTTSNLAEVYPNPSTSSFKLYLSLAKDAPASIDVYSIDGKKLQSKTVLQSKGVIDINASNYKPGLYLISVTQGSFVKTIKVIKQ